MAQLGRLTYTEVQIYQNVKKKCVGLLDRFHVTLALLHMRKLYCGLL